MTTIILAAGLSSRMGVNKLLLEFDGCRIIEHVLKNAIPSSDKTIVVLGHDKESLLPIVSSYDVDIAINEEYMKGQLSSIKCGLEKAEDDDFAFITGDLPLLRRSDIEAVYSALKENDVARAQYIDTPGHPIAYRKEYREKLIAFPGTMKEFNKMVLPTLIQCSIGTVFDIDTKERYSALLRGDCNL